MGPSLAAYEAHANSAVFEAVGQTTEHEAATLGRKAMAPFTQMISWRNQTSSCTAIGDYMVGHARPRA